ncbi:oxidoreductase [Legionella gratiana]|uniref:Oxidoreductase n=1 Tax=Legionella gratiana TaxID=45066 RepID=A0A378JH12_9GAMM|nr:SDR family NAD(P)-dependent oxidoreductase [Legionella gratiana]KTD14150.1 oxidoreductase [Legionella gratiana]STX46281.1 oxidoreductase [Legionella gratiana]
MVDDKKRIVIIGATSTIAMHCARFWIDKEPVILTLVSRDKAKTEPIAADLKTRNPQTVIQIIETHFLDPIAIRQVVDSIVAEGPLHLVLIAHGSLPDQSVCQQDIIDCHDALAINALSPVLFAEAFVGHMQKANQGTLAIIGSVAGDRGRKSNYVYGAAKGLITRYAEGLQHRLAQTNVKVILIKPGPTNTPMTASLKQQVGALAEPEDVAKTITKGLEKGKSVIYAPTKWALIMIVIRHLPSFVFNRLNI